MDKFVSNKLTWVSNHFNLILVICAVLAMAISLMIGLSQSVWFDESYSVLLAKQSVSEILRLTSLDTHPPLYYIILHIWGNLFGWSELALRSLSVLFMGGATIVAGLLTKKMFGVRTALIALPFVAFAPFLLRYGFEIRMYSLASLIGVAATYVLVTALQSKNKKQSLWLYLTYAVLVAVGVYVLYYTVLLWAAHFVWLIWRSVRNKQRIFGSKWLWAYVVSVVLFLPWVPVLIRQLTNGALAPISQAMTIENLVGIISFNFLYTPVAKLGPYLSLVTLFVILMVGYVVVRAFRAADDKQKTYIVLLGLYIVVPVAILALVGLVRPMYVERYLAHVLIGANLLVGAAVAMVVSKSGNVVRALSVGLVVVMFVGIFQLAQAGNYNNQRQQHPDPKHAAAFMDGCRRGATVLAGDPYEAVELSYYLPDCIIHFYSDTAELGGGYAPLSNSDLRVTDPDTQLNTAYDIYYVRYGSPKLQMPRGYSLKNRQVFGTLIVEEFSAR